MSNQTKDYVNNQPQHLEDVRKQERKMSGKPTPVVKEAKTVTEMAMEAELNEGISQKMPVHPKLADRPDLSADSGTPSRNVAQNPQARENLLQKRPELAPGLRLGKKNEAVFNPKPII